MASLPKINLPPAPDAQMTSKTKGAKTAPSGTLFPAVLMKKAPVKPAAAPKKTADIIQFPPDRIKANRLKNNAAALPREKESCCEQSQQLLSEINATSKSGTQTENACCEASRGVLEEINGTLKDMLELQKSGAFAQREADAEAVPGTLPGMGGFAEAVKDKGESLLQWLAKAALLTLGVSIKPLMKAWEATTKFFGDAIGNFSKAVDDWMKGLGDWWDGLWGGKKEEGDAKAGDKPAATPTPMPVMDTGRSRAKDDIRSALKRQGITDPTAVSNIMAQVGAESGFDNRAESGYGNTDNARIREVFGDRVKGLDDKALTSLKGNDQKFFDHVYGNRMGNSAAGDGWRYRGRGYIQLTGKDNYARIGKMIGVDLVKNPDLMNNPGIAARAAAAYFKDKQNSGVNLRDSNAVTAAVAPRNLAVAQAQRGALAQQFLKTDYAGVLAKTNAIKADAVETATRPSALKAGPNGNTTVVVPGGANKPGGPPPARVVSPDRSTNPVDQVSQFRR